MAHFLLPAYLTILKVVDQIKFTTWSPMAVKAYKRQLRVYLKLAKEIEIKFP